MENEKQQRECENGTACPGQCQDEANYSAEQRAAGNDIFHRFNVSQR